MIRNFLNTASPLLLTGDIVPGDDVIPVGSTADWPAAPFTASINRGTATEEVLYVGNKDGTNLLEVIRGFDGTTARSHSANDPVEHVVIALDYTEANAHVNASGGAAHPGLLPTAGGTMTGNINGGGNRATNFGNAAAAQDLATQKQLVPIGGIIMWSGSIASIPAGWALCNGSAGTPDLRGRFVVGAGGAYAPGATGGADTVALTSGQMPAHTHTSAAHTHTTPAHTHASAAHSHASGSLSTNSASHAHSMPSHSHGSGSYSTASSTHQHEIQSAFNTNTSHTHAFDTDYMAGRANTSFSNFPENAKTMSSSHSHSISGSSQSVNPGSTNSDSHNHSVSGSTSSVTPGSTGGASPTTASTTPGVTGSNGSGAAHENRPPYFALAYIMRVSF